jgi:hypothetical protein
MDLVILFDWFTNESMDAALQATEWQQREMFLRLALMWGTAAQQCRKEASTETQANSASSWSTPSELQHATVGWVGC